MGDNLPGLKGNMKEQKLNNKETLINPEITEGQVDCLVMPLAGESRGIKFNRVWAMPDKWTFKIKPIEKILHKYKVGKGWIDPFAGENSPAEITNDLNPKRPTKYHLHGKEFGEMLTGLYDGVLFDPPYSLRQVKECYNEIGIELLSKEDTNHFPRNIRNVIAKKIKPGGYAINFGWSTEGFGMKNGFYIVEILLVAHGGKHNDTIVTVEQKMQSGLFDG